MSTVYETAISYGFRLSPEFIAEHASIIVEGNEGNDVKVKGKGNDNAYNLFKEELLNMDIRKNVGDSKTIFCFLPYFNEEVNRADDMILANDPVVLQITTAVVNISNPSKNKLDDKGSAPRLLSITLTDGHTKVNAVEFQPLTDIKANCPPGTKVLYKGGRVVHGKLLLTPDNFQVIGGEVPHLYKSWEANNFIQRFHNSASLKGAKGGPPKFDFNVPKLLSKQSSGGSLISGSEKKATDYKPATVTNSEVLPASGVVNDAKKSNKGPQKNKAKVSVEAVVESMNELKVSTDNDNEMKKQHQNGKGGRGGGGGGRGRGESHDNAVGNINESAVINQNGPHDDGRGRGGRGGGRGGGGRNQNSSGGRGVVSGRGFGDVPPTTQSFTLDLFPSLPPPPPK